MQAGITAVAGIATAFGLTFLLAVLVRWTRYCARAVFLADVDEQRYDLPRLTAAIRGSNCNVLAVGGSVCQVLEIENALKAPLAARAAVASAGATGQTGSDSPPSVDAFHTLNLDSVMVNPDLRRAWLAELERVIAAGQRVVLLAASDYRDALSGSGSGLTVSHLDHPAALPDMQPGELQRWNRWMSGFSVIHAGSDFRAEEQSAGEDPESIEGFYRSLWNTCTDTEKLVLVHIAVEGFANPAQKATVTNLLRRGLLVMRPDLRAFSRGFEQFIRSSHDRATIARWERPPGSAGWGRMRWIFWSVMIAVAIFLLSTQRQWLSPAVGFVSSFAAALAAVLKLVSDFSRSSRQLDQ